MDLLKNLKRYMLIQARLVPNLTTTMEIMNDDEKNNLFDFITEPQMKWKKKKCSELKWKKSKPGKRNGKLTDLIDLFFKTGWQINEFIHFCTHASYYIFDM